MEKVIDPVPVELLLAELTPDKKLTNTNKGGNELYVVTWHNAPNVVTEIGRLREETFRAAGGATGLSIDLDEYDKMEVPFRQLIVWDPDAKAIIGGCRMMLGSDVRFDENGQPMLASAHQFHFSDEYIHEMLPHVIELGRLFVTPEYQSSKAGAKSIFALDNIWDGLGAVVMENPELMYYFGKATVYPSYDHICRDMIYQYLWKHYTDDLELIRPWKECDVKPDTDPAIINAVLTCDDAHEDYRLLKIALRERGTGVPPNLNSFISVADRLLMCGTSYNGPMNIDDTALLIPFDEICYDKKYRHVSNYMHNHPEKYGVIEDVETERALIQQWVDEREQYAAKWINGSTTLQHCAAHEVNSLFPINTP